MMDSIKMAIADGIDQGRNNYIERQSEVSRQLYITIIPFYKGIQVGKFYIKNNRIDVSPSTVDIHTFSVTQGDNKTAFYSLDDIERAVSHTMTGINTLIKLLEKRGIPLKQILIQQNFDNNRITASVADTSRRLASRLFSQLPIELLYRTKEVPFYRVLKDYKLLESYRQGFFGGFNERVTKILYRKIMYYAENDTNWFVPSLSSLQRQSTLLALWGVEKLPKINLSSIQEEAYENDNSN